MQVQSVVRIVQSSKFLFVVESQGKSIKARKGTLTNPWTLNGRALRLGMKSRAFKGPLDFNSEEFG